MNSFVINIKDEILKDKELSFRIQDMSVKRI